MKLSRRDALKIAAAVPVVRLKPDAADPQQMRAADPTLVALADVVLPAESNRKAAVGAFVSWLDHYKEGADTDHGYGVTRVRATGPSPSKNYAAQIAALDAAARSMGAPSFARAPLDQRRAIVEAAIAGSKIDRLPARPAGGHIATDLMGHYFNSSAANDLCYRAAINRDACRGLVGSEGPPEGGSYRGKE
jgi:hypothetical protein